jgi:hypothetical protein
VVCGYAFPVGIEKGRAVILRVAGVRGVDKTLVGLLLS